MQTRNFESGRAARQALVAAGFTQAFSSPGRPELWVTIKKPRRRVAIAREIRDADEYWHVVSYPEPATATPAQVIELDARDKVIVANGGFVAITVAEEPEDVSDLI